MIDQATLPQLFRDAADPSADDPRARFADFYRDHLRFRTGRRLNATKLRDSYLAWATEHRQPAISFKVLRELMTAVGHKRRISDGVQYLDVAFAEAWDDDADVLPLLTLAEPAKVRRRKRRDVTDFDRTITQIDTALASLLDARRAIEALRASEQPHVAASRIVNRPAE